MSYFIHITILISGMLLFAKIAIQDKERFYKYAVFFVISFVLRLLLIYFNNELNIFDAKLSGRVAVAIHRYFELTGSPFGVNNNFILQWLLNFPFFELNGPTATTLLIDNAFIGAIIPVFTAGFCKKIYGPRYENYILFFFSFFPCFINFSIFGIRDILILGIVSLNAVSTIYLFISNQKYIQFYKALCAYIFSILLILSIRPEMLVMLGFPLFLFCLKGLVNIRTSIKEVRTKTLIAFLSASLFLIMSVAILYFAKGFLLSNIGGSADVSTTEVIDTYAEARYERQFRGTGGGSAIVDPSSYHKLSIGSRLGIQIAGMVIIPFPWEITSITKLFAFVDTIIVLFLLFILLRAYWRQFRSKSTSLRSFLENPMNVLGLTYLFATILYGFLVINFGNAFRLRMSILPYLIIPAVYFLIHRKTFNAS